MVEILSSPILNQIFEADETNTENSGAFACYLYVCRVSLPVNKQSTIFLVIFNRIQNC